MHILNIIVLNLHVLGACVVVGSVVFVFAMLSRRPFFRPNLALMKFMWRLAEGAVGAQLLTGIYLFVIERSEFQNSPIFWSKMALFALDGFVSGMLIKRRVQQVEAQPAGETVDVAPIRSVAWVSVLIMLSIASLGVWLVETAG
jgi:hypothetical protein